MSYQKQYNEKIEEFKTISKEEKKEKEQVVNVIEKKYEITKRQLINIAADLLAKLSYEEDKISIQIKKDLEGYITKNYVSDCLENKFKNKNMIRNTPEKIIVAAGTGEQSIEEPNINENKIDNRTKNQLAREEYEKNKYYKDVPKGNVIKGPSASLANSSTTSQELEETVTSNKEQTEYITSLKQQAEQAAYELKKMQDERIMHTTVSLPKEKFQAIYDLITDKKVKRIFLDFDSNMTVTKARAEL